MLSAENFKSKELWWNHLFYVGLRVRELLCIHLRLYPRKHTSFIAQRYTISFKVCLALFVFGIRSSGSHSRREKKIPILWAINFVRYLINLLKREKYPKKIKRGNINYWRSLNSYTHTTHRASRCVSTWSRGKQRRMRCRMRNEEWCEHQFHFLFLRFSHFFFVTNSHWNFFAASRLSNAVVLRIEVATPPRGIVRISRYCETLITWEFTATMLVEMW